MTIRLDDSWQVGGGDLKWNYCDQDDGVQVGRFSGRLVAFHIDMRIVFSPDGVCTLDLSDRRQEEIQTVEPLTYQGQEFSLRGFLEDIYKNNRRLYE